MAMSDTDVDKPGMERQLLRFRRQVLQRVPVARITWPATAVLGDYEVQERIHHQILSRVITQDRSADGRVTRWLSQLCIQLSKRITAAAEVSTEGDIFDPLMEDCASVQRVPVLDEVEDAQKDVLITYVAGDDVHDTVEVTLLEKPRVVSGSGFTGHRTWEAALVLAHELAESWMPQGRLAGKRILELGSGTGLLALVCASLAAGVARIVATDGDAQAVKRLPLSIEHNTGLMVDNLAYGEYTWGEPFEDTVIGHELQQGVFDLIIGADVVSDTREYR